MTPTDEAREKKPGYEAGPLSCDIAENLIHADNAVADLFGLNGVQAENDLLMQCFIDRVHENDVAKITSVARHLAATGNPYQENCRVCGSNELINRVTSSGRAFVDANGKPCSYTDIIFPIATKPQRENKLLPHWLAAYDFVRNARPYDIAEQLRGILKDIGWRNSNLTPKRCA